jgi:hypothetical protein
MELKTKKRTEMLVRFVDLLKKTNKYSPHLPSEYFKQKSTMDNNKHTQNISL